ncbi:MAG TPA: hypothetical protein VGY58_18490, partial [Gemmataceae bacterium]|nr:hypothetical protein [Gemmataceae bacterium]
MSAGALPRAATATRAEPPLPDAPRVKQSRFASELVLFAFAAVAIATAYALLTDHVWEDYFITFRHSRNLAEGHGLVYHVGERTHGFTSPLGTLLPALLYWIVGTPSHVPSLWLFRTLSIAAFAGGGLFVLKALQDSDDGTNRL